MTNDAQPLVHSSSRQVPFQEIVTPVSARALFWRPRYLCRSDFVYHLPFLFWLIDMQRPQAAVSLGVGDGAGYFGLCQAMDRLGPEARCHGLDPRSAAEGGPSRDVRDYNEAQYADFSRLDAGDPRELVHRFEDGSVDLMIIDMALDAGLIHSLTHDWTRKLSDRAVILFHDTRNRFAAGPEQSLLQSLTQAYPTVQFPTGVGLAAVLYGADRLDKLERLSELGLGATGYAEVHHVFARLGAANHHEWAARTETARAEEALEQARAADLALSEVRDVLSAREAALEKRSHSDDTRAEQLASVQARLFDLQAAHDARAQEIAEHAKALAQVEADALREAATRDAALIRERDRAEAATAKQVAAEAERVAAQTALEALRIEAARAAEAAAGQLAVKERALALTTERLEAAQKAEAEARRQAATQSETGAAELAAAQSRIATLEEQLNAAPSGPDRTVSDPAAEASHFEEIRVLTIRLESAQQEVLTLQKELRAKADQSDRMRELEGELAAARQHVADLLSSTSWRLTGPVRKVVSTLRRQG
ncbi:class I SAM-dependent methyltransferase [Flavimaricola marinus]|uniref:Chromosome partition protein Smc n=1 Tax=Flavimaricola marinus TaxID=1819565 RepID=A0A238LI84_9RHOB|nr:class I SAM-dependent methyltransferase [Flavimaricola marinus]SMY09322.1 Chromosome partition protein Smc [Flavimaricola marinus]